MGTFTEIRTKILNGEGIPAFKGGSWATTSINRLLSNRAVLGEYQPRTGAGKVRTPAGAAVSGFFPSAIDKPLFERAQEASTNRYINRATKQSKNFNVWQGIAKCAKCQCSMHIVNKGIPPKGYAYLTCHNTRKGICDARSIRLDASELVFREILAKVGNLSLVQANAAKLEHDLQATRGRLYAAQDKPQELATAINAFPSAIGAQSLQRQEQIITCLTKDRDALAATLAADTISDKEGFFEKLDLISYEGRSQANGLLKRLKVIVRIETAPQGAGQGISYIAIQDTMPMTGFIQRPTEIWPIPFNEEQLTKMKEQGDYTPRQLHFAEMAMPAWKNNMNALLGHGEPFIANMIKDD